MSLWLVCPQPKSSKMVPWIERRNISLEPCRAITVQGLGGGGIYWIEDDGLPDGRIMTLAKPVYAVPSMVEIGALPWNGVKVVSTFSGCGGSCLGYRMAGFKVIWANEFMPHAQVNYKANADGDCFLDCRDIKQVQPAEILSVTGLQEGELDLFDGSPPCQAFSTAGRRHKNWGKARNYNGKTQCNETMFSEYIRLLRGLMPKTFIAENVSGLIKGVAKGYFLEILAALKDAGYRVACRVLDAQWLGVPQVRKRVIFAGVRNDLNLEPVYPKPLPYRYSVRDALPWIGQVVQDPHGQFAIQENTGDGPLFSIKAGSSSHIAVSELPPSRRKPDAYGIQDVDPSKPCPTVTVASPGNDLAVPWLGKYAIADEWNKLEQGQQSEKYFSLQRSSMEHPSPTIQASHGSPSTAGVCHPLERRKFTIAEVKRLCAFPDDFEMVGSFAKQWSCLGNSVPPVMMKHIAEAMRDGVLLRV